MKRIITFSGKAGCGKDTAARILKDLLEQHGQRVCILHYADLLKFICRSYLGWNGKKDEAGRELLQQVGTEVVRQQDQQYWVRFITTFIKLFQSNWDYFLIADARFPNEITCLLDDWGCEQVWSIRLDRPGQKKKLTAAQAQHKSETALENYHFDVTLIVPEGKEKLRQQLEELLSTIS